ncbi:hypothetical protein RYX56_19865 [Alkalihalophilus lindianensis]|uniref:Uncharacterized protein n=1 Tax=Alkalihalophilus lindianensis TaxID=1630542 RepID=A0ABU3XFG7_9BACI|nr:hypothetical protein [Alkalihalophilus lindianensis]MDV2686619.1 hypothetical protein [Alkalihalophilus lindianensis]
MKIKKVLFLLLIFLVVFTAVPLQGLANNGGFESETVYEYEYKGLSFTGNSELTEEQIADFYYAVTGEAREHGEVSVFSIPGGGNGGTIVGGKDRFRVDRSDIRYVANWILGKNLTRMTQRFIKTQNTIVNFTVGYLTDRVAKYSPRDMYREYWTWRVRVANGTSSGCIEEYQTLVEYDLNWANRVSVNYYKVASGC